MTDIVKIGLILMFVALLAAVGLGFVNRITAPIIEVQEEMKKQEAMNRVAVSLTSSDSLAFDSIAVPELANPYASCSDTLKIVEVVSVPDSTTEGYLFVAYGKGYSSTLQTMVAVDMNGFVCSSEVLYQMETPGLGANITDPDKLLKEFNGKDWEEILLKNDGGEIDAMTGCTITSRAVANSMSDGLEAMADAGLFSQEECQTEVAPGDAGQNLIHTDSTGGSTEDSNTMEGGTE